MREQRNAFRRGKATGPKARVQCVNVYTAAEARVPERRLGTFSNSSSRLKQLDMNHRRVCDTGFFRRSAAKHARHVLTKGTHQRLIRPGSSVVNLSGNFVN